MNQLGIEPGPELRELKARILREDATLEFSPFGSRLRDDRATPPTHYVQSGGVHIAYRVVGDGERDIVYVPGLMSHVELAWEDPSTVAFYRRLAALGRLIPFDKRDTGLSDRAPRDFEQPGDRVLRFAEGEELDALFTEIENFLAASPPATERTRVLTTILLADGIEDLDSSQRVAYRVRLRTRSPGSIIATFDAPGMRSGA